jgi:hypothetical protein
MKRYSLQVTWLKTQGGVPILGLNMGAHLLQRPYDTAHRPLAQLFAPIQEGRKWLAGQEAGQQAQAGTSIAAVKGVFRRLQTI